MKKTNFTHLPQKTHLNILPINHFRWAQHGHFCPDSSGQQVKQHSLMTNDPLPPMGTSANPPRTPHHQLHQHSALVSRPPHQNAPQSPSRARNGHRGHPSPATTLLPLYPSLPGQFRPYHHTSAHPHVGGGQLSPSIPAPYIPLQNSLKIPPHFPARNPPPFHTPIFTTEIAPILSGGGQRP